ncbi:MAG: TraR/DksA family transcriptional regulator [Sedimenticola thiotaurini]|uniref:TraR/DksA family transcriptional regulator n=1 Tax=Sedimenticola thiotaurini TaxID=1543721 RepID=A0A558DF91_9GAMM|nr:MAG: TraR/DksA family transcriptional regulator [Sedimenticola thiotaurini]
MTELDSQRYLHRLIARRDELKSVSATADAAAETVELDQTRVGRLSRMDAMQLQAMSQENQRRRSEELVRISQALSRIKADEYGYCVECGEAIAENRLAVDPAQPLCIQCASAHEKEQGI